MNKEKWIVLDVDDVLFDFAGPLEKALKEKTGKDIPHNTWPSYRQSLIYDISSDEVRALFHTHQILEKGTPLHNVKDFMQSLTDKGYKIGVITARAWHPMGKELTEKMFKDHNLPVERVVVNKFDQKKTEVLHHYDDVEIVGYMDDSASHVADFNKIGIAAYVLSKSWNKGIELPRVETIEEFANKFPSLKTEQHLSKNPKPKI